MVRPQEESPFDLLYRCNSTVEQLYGSYRQGQLSLTCTVLRTWRLKTNENQKHFLLHCGSVTCRGKFLTGSKLLLPIRGNFQMSRDSFVRERESSLSAAPYFILFPKTLKLGLSPCFMLAAGRPALIFRPSLSGLKGYGSNSLRGRDRAPGSHGQSEAEHQSTAGTHNRHTIVFFSQSNCWAVKP